MVRSAISSVVFVSVLYTSACGDPRADPTDVISAPGSGLASVVSEEMAIRPEEAPFYDLERRVQGSGGFFKDSNGVLKVWLRGHTPERVESVKSAVRSLATVRARVGSSQPIEVLQAQYSFSQLARWRDHLTAHLLGRVEGIVSTDADETRNRVVVGVLDDRSGAAVEEVLDRLGIPQDAVLVSRTGGLAPTGAFGGPPAASNFNGEIYAGLAVGYNQGPRCTVGLFATFEGQDVMVIPSHCSTQVYDGPGDNTFYYNYDGQTIGYEWHDRGFHDFCFNPGLNRWGWCRDSDANITRVTTSDFAIRKDRIVNYIHTHQDTNSTAYYREIDLQNPLTIVARSTTLAGDEVYKAGAISGETVGVVNATCMDVFDTTVLFGRNVIEPYQVFRCQHEATVKSAHGDSGAPVYALTYYGDADIRGIQWAIRGNGNSVFSPISGIEDDFGILQDIPGTYTPGGGGTGCDGEPGDTTGGAGGPGGIDPC